MIRRTTRSNDSDIGLGAGLLWRVSDRWSLGASARSSFRAHTVWEGLPGPASKPGDDVGFRLTGDFEFPGVLSVGACFRAPDGRWTAINSGLGPNDQVVLHGAYELKLASQQSGGQQEGVHVHADGTVHTDH